MSVGGVASVVLGALMIPIGVVVLVLALRSPFSHPEWNPRHGPGRWLAVLAMALILGGAVNVLIGLQDG